MSLEKKELFNFFHWNLKHQFPVAVLSDPIIKFPLILYYNFIFAPEYF